MSILKAFGQTLFALFIIFLVYGTGLYAISTSGWWVAVWLVSWGTLLMWSVNKI